MKPICRGVITVILVSTLFACSNGYIRGQFQEDVPGGGQSIINYEMQGDEVKQVVQSTESTHHFIESTFRYVRGDLSSVCVLVSEFVRNDNFDITDVRKVATFRWVAGGQGLVLKEGNFDGRLLGKNRDYLAEGERIKRLADKHRGGTL